MSRKGEVIVIVIAGIVGIVGIVVLNVVVVVAIAIAIVIVNLLLLVITITTATIGGCTVCHSIAATQVDVKACMPTGLLSQVQGA